MFSIWKYTVEIRDHFTVSIPRDSKFLSVQSQRGEVYMWWLVQPSMKKIDYHFSVVGTGHEQSANIQFKTFLGTFQLQNGAFVAHLFENQESRGMKDKKFLCWLHEHLSEVHGVNRDVDYMHKLRAIIFNTPMDTESKETSTSSNIKPGELFDKLPD